MRKQYLKAVYVPVISLVLLLAPLFTTPAYAALERQPYLQSVSDTRVVLRWRTTSSATSRVRYGLAPGSLNTIVDSSGSTTEHEVVITGLTPNTKYYYSVGSTTGTVEAGNNASYYFITAPNVGSSRKVRIWAIGDPGTNNSDQYNVRDAYYNLDNVETDVILTLGDNAYDNGTDSEYTTNFFNVYKDIFRHAAVWATRGNHEKDYRVHEAAFTHPKRAESGGIASGSELYYSFDYGNIHFVCLDSFTSANLNGSAMYNWLENDLASTTQEWIIAFWHHPPYTRSVNHDSDTEAGQKIMREKANPILEKYGVDLQLGGHNHFYARTFLINKHYGTRNTFSMATHAIDGGNGRTDGDGAYQKASNPEGAVYVLAGSSGKLGTSGNVGGYNLGHPANYTEKMLLGSMVIDIDGDRMDVRMLRDNGTVQDYFTITKTAAVNQPPQVNAGVNQNAQTGAVINLDGTVNDDGMPSSALTYTWSKTSGPGNVSFGNASSVDTTASFSAAGSYVLQLEASDSLLTGNDSVIITVTDAQNVDTDGDGINDSADPDDDNDGMPDVWELQYGFDPLNAGDAGQDADGDGISNLQEYQQGSNPLPVYTGPMTQSFQDGVGPDASYAGTRDTTLYQSQPNSVFGSGIELGLDGDSPGGSGNDVSSLLRWDISAIPSGSVIESVEVTVEVTNSSSGNYGVYELLAPWNEAQATWNVSAAGTSWGTAGASGFMDHDTTQLATVGARTTGSYTFSLNSSGVAMVQVWLDDPVSNNGLLITDSGITDGIDFYAREATTATFRPKLTITYLSPGNGGTTPNQAPRVDAGVNQNTQTDAVVSLNGTVTDDGQPSSVLSYSWSKVSGPGSVSFGNASAVDTTVSFSTAGSYVLQLAASDSLLTGSDQVVITVSNPVTNQPPRVNAGANQNAITGAGANLNGTVTDDGLPGGSLSYHWSKLSGPGNASFGNANAVDTTVSFSGAGRYVLQLVASDSLLTGSDQVVITVSDPVINQPPQVSAGADQNVNAGTTVNLNGTVTDDGQPGSALTFSWSKLSGPGNVRFGNSRIVDTTASFSAAGNYVLQLAASDSALTGVDTVVINVSAVSGGANKPPVVNAGPDLNVQSAEAIHLYAFVSDDALPGGILIYNWTRVSGPDGVRFGDAGSVSTSVSFSSAGRYVIKFEASDGVLTGSDEVAVIVSEQGVTQSTDPAQTSTGQSNTGQVNAGEDVPAASALDLGLLLSFALLPLLRWLAHNRILLYRHNMRSAIVKDAV